MRQAILVVEDYADLRSAIVAALERDYACDSVRSSEDAVEMLRTHDYAAILLAPRLPIGDDPLVHYLVENSPGELRKVIVMSDPSTPTAGCCLLEKPFTNEQLIASVRGRT